MDEVRRLAVGFEPALVDRDGLEYDDPARPEAIVERPKIVRPECLTDRFDHFNRYDPIEGAADITVVAELKRDLIDKAALSDAAIRVSELLGGKRHTCHASALLSESIASAPQPHPISRTSLSPPMSRSWAMRLIFPACASSSVSKGLA